VRLYPVPVQGEGAGEQIAQAIRLADRRQDCDVLLLVRGGGSLEDLWAFNEAVVARAIHACTIPIVSGIGHEIDVTIADFAADQRAPTPSAAAELVSPDRLEWLHRVVRLEERLTGALRRRLGGLRQTLTWLQQRLARQQPARRLQDRAQRLDELEQRLQRAIRLRLERSQGRLAGLTGRLQPRAPTALLQRWQDRCQHWQQRLQAAMRRRLEQPGQRLAVAVATLQTVSPLQTLARGYAIVRRQPDGEIVRRAAQVPVGETVEAVLAEGTLVCRVEGVNEGATVDVPEVTGFYSKGQWVHQAAPLETAQPPGQSHEP
jgi:exodeoxyribonuclease VII large subunit